MYQPQDYGKAFMESFTGMGNYLTGTRKADSDQKQREFENARQLAADQRAQTQLDDNLKTNSVAREHTQTQTDETRRKADQEKTLQDGAIAHANLINGKATKADLDALAKFRVSIPDLANDTANQQQEFQNGQIMQEGADMLEKMPASNVPMIFQQGDHPMTDKYLNMANSTTTPNRFKEFIDEKGTITGTPGAKYSTDKIYGGAIISGNGTGSVVHRMSIVDSDGRPIYEKDQQGNVVFRKNDDGTVMTDPTTREPVPQPKLVPSTFGKSNDGNDQLNLIPSSLMKVRGDVITNQIKAERTIPPEKQPEYAALLEKHALAYSNPKEYFTKSEGERRLNSLTPEQKAAFGEGGERMLAVGAKLGLPPDKTVELAQKSAEAGQARTDKLEYAKTETEAKRQDQARRGKERQQDRQDNIKLAASLRGGADDKERNRTKFETARRLRDAQRNHQTALKTGDPDAINESINLIEQLNADATELGVKPQPVPKRLFSRDEEDIITGQALKNINQQRSGVAKFFGTTPNRIAIAQEANRLRKTVKPGAVNFGNADTVQATNQTAQTAPAPDAQQQPASAMHAMPPAAQHSGKIIRETVTGKRYQSNGSGWVEVR
jgi:hypothetical protein